MQTGLLLQLVEHGSSRTVGLST